MSDIQDLGYGRQFADFYHRIFPPGDDTAKWLAGLHPGDGMPALELGVGTGRVALPLAAHVGDLVGVDSSPEMLDVLRGALAAEPRPVTPVHGDIRTYRSERRYGLVLCVCGTLSMLLDPAEQQQVLETCALALGPGGAVVIETHNPAFVEAMHEGRAKDTFFIPCGENAGLQSYSLVNYERQIWHLSHIWHEGGGTRLASETSRLTTPDEIDTYAERAGLLLEARYGSWQGSPFTGTEPMTICVYRSADDLREQ
ncbi:class I SAM-dependent methyltransferase [Streptomyces muensis]|uniref:Class I SAM-dependent methyltransferase n=1 Tax=Streptomyces muensis TaxID=1077944 RepID=A0A9X1PWY7_STRM4|nr:class I SAM-dependent methyltransferase [Streptomyces muensis]MCF1592911.1 class I SAM-dependent methyltransferase [Streptomyces muensis]